MCRMRSIDEDYWFDGRLVCSKRIKVGKPEPRHVVIEAIHFKGGGYRVAYFVDDSSFRDYGCPRCTRDARKMVRGLVRRLKSGEEVVKGNKVVRRVA